jgi:hypothetical protein
MTKYNRADLEARYRLFNHYALDDQRNYYSLTLEKYRKSARQVNRIRALLAFLTGAASALAGFIVQSSFVSNGECVLQPGAPWCQTQQTLAQVLIILAVALPAFGAFFGTLADLYQWDRMVTIYDSALENLEFADAQSPWDEMDDNVYQASLHAFVDGTLQVMSDETAQWGQSIRTPPETDTFIEQMRQRAREVGGDADSPPAPEGNKKEGES